MPLGLAPRRGQTRQTAAGASPLLPRHISAEACRRQCCAALNPSTLPQDGGEHCAAPALHAPRPSAAPGSNQTNQRPATAQPSRLRHYESARQQLRPVAHFLNAFLSTLHMLRKRGDARALLRHCVVAKQRVSAAPACQALGRNSARGATSTNNMQFRSCTHNSQRHATREWSN